jgi:hypothetical protein
VWNPPLAVSPGQEGCDVKSRKKVFISASPDVTGLSPGPTMVAGPVSVPDALAGPTNGSAISQPPATSRTGAAAILVSVVHINRLPTAITSSNPTRRLTAD